MARTSPYSHDTTQWEGMGTTGTWAMTLIGQDGYIVVTWTLSFLLFCGHVVTV